MAVPTSKPLDAYVTGTRAWFPDVKAGWVSATQAKDPETDEASGDLVLTFNMDESGEEHLIRITAAQQESNAVLEHLPPLRNPPLLEAADDLTSLSHLNEASVLHTILNRYQQRIIYTYSGIVLIAVNPFFSLNLYSPEIIQAYAGRRKGELEPHLFAVAEDAYRCMIRENRNQTIVVSGESGAGKTMSAKYIMRYFATVEDPDRPQARRTNKDAGGMSETEKAILATNPIMEAFGNAKTTRNDNSSRFGKYLEILFDANYEIAGAKMRTYLLERSRLVYQPEHERNYHIFYQLCAGASQELKLALQLDSAESYHYLNQGGASNLVIAGVDDQAEFLETQKALEIVGIDPAAQAHMFEVLAALLHLGNIAILATRSDSNIAPDDANLLLAAKFLGVDAGELRKWTLKRQMQMRGEKIVSSLSQAHAVAVRDSVAKYVYTCLFDWLVTQMNKSLAPATALEKSTMIGVLDIYGFECFETNSYEQFCINYANERLQHEFNRHVFKLEQEEYVAEQIPWEFISFSDNQPCIDLIQSKFGVLSLLDEESRLPSGTDTGFLQKMYNQLLPKVEFQPFLMKPRFKSESAFTVRHYALDVTYDVEGFMEKNKDTVPDETLSLLSATSNPFLRQVLESRQEETPTDSSLASSNPRKTPGVSITAKKPTLGSQFKSSLSSLMDTINSTEVHYIRCIKPNDQKQAWEVEPQNVLGQLRACGVLETIRISCAGYPSRWTFAEFVDRYYLVAHSKYWDMSSLEKVAELAKHILSTTLEPSMYYVGLTKIFFRAGVLASFEQMRRSILHERTKTIQTAWRRHHVQSRYRCLQQGVLACQTAWRAKQAQRQYQLARETNAARQLQTWVRAVMQRRRFLAMRNTVVQLQIAIRAYQARMHRQQAQHAKDATGLQRLVRGALTRRQIKRRQRHVVLVQSLYRRRIARRDLEQRRVEARSASHLQEVSYRLENKVVDLTQSLHDRTRENRELRATLQDLEKQLNTWQSRHEELDARAKGLQEEVERPSVPADEHEQMVEERVSLVAQLDQAQRRINELEAQIQDLQTQLNARALEEKEDGPDSVVHTLRQEIATLRDQLGRANALNAKNGGTVPLASAAAREAPKGPRAVRMASGETPVGSEASLPPLPTDQSPLLNSVTSPDALQDMQRDANTQVLDDEPEVPAEEIIELLENDTQLDEDVLEGLIRYLKVPAPSLQNPPSMKEVLFPAHLISLVTNEMWKYGLVHESERFLANVMQTIQQHVMDFQGDDAIIPGIFWLSNVHEILSFVCIAESDMLQGVGPGLDGSAREFEWGDYERLVTIVKHDLDSLEYNIYHTWMQQSKKLLNKMVVPALVESQSLPGFITNDSGGRLLNRLLAGNHAPTYTMDDILALLNKTWKCLKSYYVEPSVTQQVITELLKMIGVTSFNDLLMRRNFCSWKRAMQIQYNITRLEEWCKSHDMPEGSLQLEHLLQATKLLQLKKATMSDIDIIYDVCWMLTPTQIQKLISHYHVADYENPISPEILKAVASRVVPNDRNDHLLLPPEVDEAGPYELPAAREVTGIETYCPAYLNVPLLRNLAGKVA